MTISKNPFDAYWSRLCECNPKLAEEAIVVKMSTEVFRASVAKAFRAGQDDAQKRAEAAKDFEKLGRSETEVFAAGFERIFGGRR